MIENELLSCRKCGTPNPKGNEYCRQCGAILSVSTFVVKAQSKLVLPARKGIRWQLVGLGALVILGLITVLIGILILIAWLALDIRSSVGMRDLGALTDEFLGLSIAAVCLFLIAFGLGGFVLAWLSKQQTVIEPVIAAFVVLLLLGVVGSTLTNDALVITALLVLPLVTLAGLGGRIGELFTDGVRKQ